MASIREIAVNLMPNYAVRVASSPYIAGDSLEAAMSKVRTLLQRNISSTIDVLGEDTTSQADCNAHRDLYHRILDTIATEYHNGGVPPRRRPSVSLKPSSFVVLPEHADGPYKLSQLDLSACVCAIEELVAHAQSGGINVTVDMEDHRWTDFTLSLYKKLFTAAGRTVGTVIQSMLFRSEQDIETLPEGCRIRFCIGIYNEPAEVAHRDRREMKQEMLRLVPRLFDKNIYVEWATHEQWLIERFFRDVIVPRNVPPNEFETQMLLGVPRDRLVERIVSGELCESQGGSSGQGTTGEFVHRLYVPFTEDWRHAVAYSRRRLKGSPSLFWVGVRTGPRILFRYLTRR